MIQLRCAVKWMRSSAVWSGSTVALLLVLAGVSLTHAQLPVGTISGIVRDTSGAVIPGGMITATNRETGAMRAMEVSANGRYAIAGLPVGEYDVRAEAPAFAPQTKQNLGVAIGQDVVVNFTMNVGSVAEAVTVTAEVPLVETTSGSLGTLVDEQKVAELPLNGRNFNQLVLLQPGISQHQQTSRTSTTGIGLAFSSGGAPIRSNYMMLDGANILSAEGIAGVSVTGSMLGVEGIREYRVMTSNFPAEYGMTMGSQTTIVTKGGTNQYHGSLFEYLRNSALDARNFFDRRQKETDPRIPDFRRNNFGGSFGGPIKQNKLFYFVTYEGVREALGITQPLTTINAPARTDGFLVPTVSPTIKPFLALYPLPTDAPFDNANGSGAFTYIFKQPTREDYGQTRFDYTLNDKDSLFGRYTITDTSRTDPSERWPDFPRIGGSRGQFTTLAENHIFTPMLLNMFRFSYSRTFQRFDSPTIMDPAMEFFEGKGMGGLSPGNPITGLGPGTPWIRFDQNLFTMSNDVFWTRSSHSLKFGTLVNRYQVFVEPSTNWRGSYSFQTLSDFLRANPRSFNTITPGSNTYRVYRWYTLGFYAQDDFRASSRLTLNLGLRYEVLTSINEMSRHCTPDGNTNAANGGTCGSSLRNVITDDRFVVNPQLIDNPSLKNFSPRFGFAWDVFGDSSMAVRGGAALLYDIGNMAPATQVNANASPPFSSGSLVTVGTTRDDQGNLVTSASLGFPNPNIPNSARGKAPRIIDYNLQQPHMIHYNLTMERRVPGNMVVSAGFAASRGFNLYQTKEGNPTTPSVVDGRLFWQLNQPRRNPNWDEIELKTAAGDSWYNSLRLSLERRLSAGLQFQSSYTWSKVLDTTQGQKGGEGGGGGTTGIIPENKVIDKGPADFNTPHSWTSNLLYNVPSPQMGGVAGALLRGWRVGSILTLRSGLPFTVTLSGNHSRSRNSGSDRPDLAPGRTFESITSGTSSGCGTGANAVKAGTKLEAPYFYFDPCAFQIPNLGFLGTAGRNILYGPSQANVDFSLAKEFPAPYLGEGGKWEFRAEAFNVLNKPNFFIPENKTAYTATDTTPADNRDRTLDTPTFNALGQITRTRGTARQIQFALRLTF